MTDNPAELIKAAFQQARNAGKKDWYRMTTAVLKNRLLALTDGAFDETNYGVRTVRDFVKLASDVVRLDESSVPPVLALREEEPVRLEAEPPSKTRVRPDLWRAVLDFTHGPFVWEPESQRAREALPTDNLPIMPTLSADELRAWRGDFVRQHEANLDASSLKQLSDWQARILSSKTLPKRLSTLWLSELKDKVAERLRSWFGEYAIQEPADFLLPVVTPRTPESGVELKALRLLVIDCIKVMTEQELSDLRLSPAVILRASHGQRRRTD
jgi:hypothetical protein